MFNELQHLPAKNILCLVPSLAVQINLLVDKRNLVREDHTPATVPTQPVHIPVSIYLPEKRNTSVGIITAHVRSTTGR